MHRSATIHQVVQHSIRSYSSKDDVTPRGVARFLLLDGPSEKSHRKQLQVEG